MNIRAETIPYIKLMRLDKPAGWWLLLHPCLWSLTLASQGIPDIKLVILFTLGAIIMRSAGCVINDMTDKDLDAHVSRTAVRPLASGQLTPFQALSCLGLLLTMALIIALQLNTLCLILSFAVLPLVVTYPWMKRLTYWPQAFLGLTFNWGAIMGWAAVMGEISLPAIILYIFGIAWTLHYDTIYAYQDRDDDMLIGVKSSAVKLGDKPVGFLWGCFAVMMICLLALGQLQQATFVYYGLIVLPAVHLVWQIMTLDIKDTQRCHMLFKSNINFGWLLLFALVLNHLHTFRI
ncbi:MAG: 4-hydroxybenzoate octaprenyltransferase [Alphaproteobacteria bacterium]